MVHKIFIITNLWVPAVLLAVLSMVSVATVGAQVLYVQPNGDVGIGGSGSVARLDVHGVSEDSHGVRNVVNDDIGDPSFMLTLAGILDWRLSIDNSDGYKFKIDRSAYTGGNTKLTIDTGGNVGIGTASPTEKLHVAGRIRTNSQVYNSSEQLKTDISPLENSLEAVLALRGVSFRWRDDGRQDVGLVAEEVDEILPVVVAYEESGGRPYAVDYARLVPVLIEAVKNQQQQIWQLRDQLQGLASSASASLAGPAMPEAMAASPVSPLFSMPQRRESFSGSADAPALGAGESTSRAE
ncbi:MAG: tail fiber domain-containing protein [Holophagales bacterium]|nr:tail fiber domain-containing protein [Holophagales bacterium]